MDISLPFAAASFKELEGDSNLEPPRPQPQLPPRPIPLVQRDNMHGNSPGYEEAREGQLGVILGGKGLVENAQRRTRDVGEVAIHKGEELGEGGGRLHTLATSG